MSEETSNKSFLKKTYDNLITNVSNMGLYKEFIIIVLILLIILVGLYDHILPLFIQFDSNFWNNLTALIPLFICIIIITLALCSHFKIFGKNVLFGFNHKIINLNKYKKVIASKIEDYKNKLYKIQKVYNENDLIRIQLKNNIENLNEKNLNLTNMAENLLKDCSNLNEKNDKLVGRFIDKTEDTLQNIQWKGTELFNQAKEWKKIQYNKARQREAEDSRNQAVAEKLERDRIKFIQDEKDRREKAAAAERLRRLEAARKAKLAWKNRQLSAIHENTKRFVYFYSHHRTLACGGFRPPYNWDNFGYKALGSNGGYMVCGHDNVTSMTVPPYAIVKLFYDSNYRGRAITVKGNGIRDRLISSIVLQYFGLNHVGSSVKISLNTKLIEEHKKRLDDKPLVDFGDLVVEGEYPPGINAKSTK